MTVKRGDRRRLYGEIRRVEETCPYGGKHFVPVYAIKSVVATGRTKPSTNGYTNFTSYEYKDRQGNSYWTHEGIDYYNSFYYVSNNMTWTTHPNKRQFARDAYGNPIDWSRA